MFLSWSKIIALSNNFPSTTTRKLILSKKALRRGIIIFVLFQVFDLFLNSDFSLISVWRQLLDTCHKFLSSVYYAAAAAAKSLQSCPTLCNPIDGLLPGSSVPGILQARTLEWVAISFSNAWKWKVKSEVTHSCPTLKDLMDCSLPGSSSMGFSRQEYWSGVPSPSLRRRLGCLKY